MVVLPGMDGTDALLSAFRAELGPSTTVITYPPDRPLDYAGLEELVAGALPQDGQVVLIAESFSGPLALRLAGRPGGILAALVLVCSFARLPSLARAALRLVRYVPFWLAPPSLFVPLLLGRHRSRALEASLVQALKAVAPRVWRARLRALSEADETQTLARVQVPLLVLCASEDRLLSAATSAIVSRAAGTAQVVELEGPHLLLLAKPAEAASAIRHFARSQGIAL